MSSRPHPRLKSIVITLTLFYSGLSNAGSNTFFPLYPRLNVTGGIGDNSYGAADVMAPLFGSTDAIFYTDVNAQIDKSKSWLASLGLGTRDAINNDLMLGGYIFADRFQSGDDIGGNNWLVFNPGVEFMSNHWDGRINSYIPSGERKKLVGVFFGDQVNEPDAITRTGHSEFVGHDQFNVLFDKIEEIGPGADLDAGYTFTQLHRLRLHAGIYYFNIPDVSDINGGEAGIEMPINNHLLLQFDDSYNNVQKNTSIVSVRFTLGGMDKSCATPIVQDRMLDPIYRHLGSLGTNSAVPVNTRIINTRQIALERSNIWFFNAASGAIFDPSAGDNNCTFEHPCIGTDFNQSNIGTINGITSGANFYFTPGTYNLFTSDPYHLDIPSYRLSLYSGQSMYGRTSDYTMPASSASGFPTFVGGLDPKGNNTLDSFALINNNNLESIGINIVNTQNVLMNNLQIGGTDTTQTYQESVVLNNAQNITLSDSTINTIQNGPQARVTGITEDNGSAATITSNMITITGKNSLGIFGLFADHGSTATINNNNFTFNMTNARDGMTGIDANNNSVLNANSNNISMTLTKPTGNNDQVTGIASSSSATVNSNGNTITITSTSQNDFIGGGNIGLLASNGTINSSNDNFTFNNFGNNSADATGIIVRGGNVTVAGDIFTFNTTHLSSGIRNFGGTVTGDNNIFNFTGTGTKICGSFTSGTNNQFIGNCT